MLVKSLFHASNSLPRVSCICCRASCTFCRASFNFSRASCNSSCASSSLSRFFPSLCPVLPWLPSREPCNPVSPRIPYFVRKGEYENDRKSRSGRAGARRKVNVDETTE